MNIHMHAYIYIIQMSIMNIHMHAYIYIIQMSIMNIHMHAYIYTHVNHSILGLHTTETKGRWIAVAQQLLGLMARNWRSSSWI